MKTLAIAILLLCCGCNRGDPRRAAVEGKITLDGEPIAEGAITLFPMDETKGPSAGASFANGRYAIAAAQGPVVGRYRVEIRGLRKTGRQVPAPGPIPDPSAMMDEVVEIVPKRYNKNSTLVAEVKSGKNVFDYELSSKEVPPQGRAPPAFCDGFVHSIA